MRADLYQKHGFTMIELIVVIAVIGVLASVAAVGFGEVRQQARDDIRISQLEQMRLAIELYKTENGRYPEQGCGTVGSSWAGLGDHPTWGANCTNWIIGLVPEYIPELPKDPNRENELGMGFIYRTNTSGTLYKLMVHNSVESKRVYNYDHPYARCPRDCNQPLYCDDFDPVNPQRSTYAVYSAGAECL
jgi:prepilin-type N-terminal cleavage/methylation domain-containing protein